MTEAVMPHVTVIPLYGFSLDAESAELDTGIALEAFHGVVSGSLYESWTELSEFCHLFPPDFLLSKTTTSDEGWLHFVGNGDGVQVERRRDANQDSAELDSWVQALRLFKPQAFRAAGTWVLATGSHANQIIGVQASVIHPENAIYIHSGAPEAAYHLQLEEIPFLKAFRATANASLDAAVASPRFKVAWDYFNFSFNTKPPRYQFVDLVVSLEALFLKDEGELSSSLSLRLATLLGTDGIDRKRIFGEMKKFYDTRSKILHGRPLKEKHTTEINQLPRLRDLTRKALLAGLALGSSVGFETEFDAALEEMALDGDRRTEFQRNSSGLLFVKPNIE